MLKYFNVGGGPDVVLKKVCEGCQHHNQVGYKVHELNPKLLWQWIQEHEDGITHPTFEETRKDRYLTGVLL